MEKKVIISAKTAEEAITKAVEELGAPNADAIKVTVLEEATKGFLGLGAKQAKIEATYKVGNERLAGFFVEGKSYTLVRDEVIEKVIYRKNNR